MAFRDYPPPDADPVIPAYVDSLTARILANVVADAEAVSHRLWFLRDGADVEFSDDADHPDELAAVVAAITEMVEHLGAVDDIARRLAGRLWGQYGDPDRPIA